eukprot:CAMPEP_0116871700 /NCGR_PEP_ID=MMETSP0463-20121206/2177_1 /TAXON_ID=181622 /ORGANISM="Strombidinopsis sp, Strain SopsisLIS2011" /LENGTH=60 /DNA_ID=CAMNT_0004510637 /DNA_START=1316 /DNA_END=1498 /DNA_ORIENTATION=-
MDGVDNRLEGEESAEIDISDSDPEDDILESDGHFDHFEEDFKKFTDQLIDSFSHKKPMLK